MIMKRTWLLVLVLFALSAPKLRGQTITGSGTANTVPKFTGTYTLGNSPISISGTNVGIGTTSPLFPLHIFSENSTPPPGQDRPIALLIETSASTTIAGAPAVGIEIVTSAQQGSVIGVHGVNYFSPNGLGVLGSGGQGSGVYGSTDATVFQVGVGGTADAETGPAAGVFGQAHSPGGDAGLFANFAGGNILRGQSGANGITVFRVDGNGTVFAEGGFRPHGADFAESMPVVGNRDRYQPGDLMVIDPAGNQRLALSDKPYSTLVAGIYSTSPGVVGSQHPVDKPGLDSEVPLAIVGIVPCNVTAENGPIAVGDLLVTSSAPGRAMKGTDRTRMLGAVVGKALEPLQNGNGVIQVLVTLQ
jgi:hypothetical protein